MCCWLPIITVPASRCDTSTKSGQLVSDQTHSNSSCTCELFGVSRLLLPCVFECLVVKSSCQVIIMVSNAKPQVKQLKIYIFIIYNMKEVNLENIIRMNSPSQEDIVQIYLY